jgi:hypothetical protein
MDAWRRNDEFDGRLHPDLPEIGMLPFRHQIASVSHPSLRLGGESSIRRGAVAC